MARRKKPVRYAVVGQGYFAQVAVLPAFKNPRVARVAELAALVSDDPTKLEKLGEEYGVPVERRAGYDDYDRLLASGEVDAVYIALPNSMHRDFTERAARAGRHVLCEKPLAVTPGDAEAMIAACRDAGVRLMTAYRLHFEEANLRAAEIVRSGEIGTPRYFSSIFSMQVKEGNIRLSRELGGGPLWDIGIYCINAARALFREEPRAAFAFGGRPAGDPRFDEVHEQVSCVLRFSEDRLAQFTVSFGALDLSAYDIVGDRGHLHVEPAYEFAADLKHVLTVEGKQRRKTFKRRDQVGPELIYFARCIREDREPEPSGLEGWCDLRVIDALYRSMKTGAPVELPPFEKPERPTIEQEIHVSPHGEPDLVNAEQPSP
jgi:glucose-fructose oxidoreductase